MKTWHLRRTYVAVADLTRKPICRNFARKPKYAR